MTARFDFDLVPLSEDLAPYVYSSWIQSHHEGSPATRAVQWSRYKACQAKVIARAIATGHVVVAVDPVVSTGERRQIYGWACGWADDGVGVLHYAYVTQSRRGHGLARDLVAKIGVTAGVAMTQGSHSTLAGAGVGRRLGLTFSPFALIRMMTS